MIVKVQDIHPNPYRQIDRYPVSEEKVGALLNSIGETGWWENIVCRSSPSGGVEQAHGHHRVEALLRHPDFGPEAEVAVIVKDLDNDMMLRMMAEENLREWESNFVIEVETIRAVLAAADAGSISLRAFDPSGPGHRPDNTVAGDSIIPDSAIAEYLGANWTRNRVQRCTTALRELGEGTEELEGVAPTIAPEVIRAAKHVAGQKKTAPTKRDIVREVTKIANGIRSGELRRDDVREMAGHKTGRGSTYHRQRIDHPEQFAPKVAKAISAFIRTDALAEALDQIVLHHEAFSGGTLLDLARTLDSAAERATTISHALRQRAEGGRQ